MATGRLKMVFTLGPPRSGTTAFHRFLFEGIGLKFTGNVNQPGLLDRGANARWLEAMWENVENRVLQLESAQTRPDPVHLVIKETSNIVCPTSTHLGDWASLSLATVILVRQPLLQLESRVICNLKRLAGDSIAAFRAFDVHDKDLRDFRFNGQQLIRSDADLSHIDFSPNAPKTVWQQHFSHMQKSRDLSSLNIGFVDFCALHPQFEVSLLHGSLRKRARVC